MKKILIKNAIIVNENRIETLDLLIEGAYISKIDPYISDPTAEILDASGLHLFPGMIDDQVHFREPGLTHKATIFSESRAAVAGGITSFMEMPNTVPNTLTQILLEDKYQIAKRDSVANYSFFMGASNENLDQVLQTNAQNVCGVKIFMGSSTGNMLVDNRLVLEKLFSECPMLIATHCEDEATIQKNWAYYQEKYDVLQAHHHSLIRDSEACYTSSKMAVELAKKHNTRLHILHISTEKELELFDNTIALEQKRITAEACIHHLWFSEEDYTEKGNWIKWNPAIKKLSDRDAIRNAVNSNLIDVIATDHAPHTIVEKQQSYSQAPSGGPLVQHALQALLDLYHQGVFTLEKIVEKTAHHPSITFQIEKRGYIREGYFADLVLVDLQKKQTIQTDNILSLCKWSPFEGYSFASTIEHTFVSGNWAYKNGKINSDKSGKRLGFDRG